jgi:hypothetical protein
VLLLQVWNTNVFPPPLSMGKRSSFTKTGSGQTHKKTLKRRGVSAAATGDSKADSSAAATAAVEVDMSAAPWLAGREPLAIRLGWPLFGIPYSPADTCCPTATVQAGRGVCIPGNCPLYSETSELPANPFFAEVSGGKCKCMPPQVCDE